LLALGEEAPTEHWAGGEIRFLPYQNDPAMVARYYQAADAYLHAARADTFPTTVLEALACGCPVIATKAGGIPEQFEDGISGFLIPPGDAGALAACARQLLTDRALRQRLSQEGLRRAAQLYDQRLQSHRYLEWFAEILERRLPAGLGP
jgi:glycosyltransferase involved in cell wall biosynthesis